MSITNFGIENHTHQCQQCGMKFYNSHQLVNHMKKFCSASGFNTLEGLAQYQHSSNFSKKLKNYGAHSLGSMKYQPEYSPKQLAKQAIEAEKHRQQLSINRPYSNTNANNNLNRKNQYGRGNQTDMDLYQQSKVQKFKKPQQINQRVIYGQKLLQGSQVSIKSLGNFGKQISQPQIQTKRSLGNSDIDFNYYSPPTNLPSQPFAKHTGPSMLDKSNSSIANMSLSQKKDYASVKLVQLDNIAQMYDKSGGMSMDFRKNLDKMRKFYRKMLEDDQPLRQYPGQFAQSRAQTPISKLRQSQINENKMNKNKNGPADSLDRQLMSKMSGKKINSQKIQKKEDLGVSKKSKANKNQNIFSTPQPYMGYPNSYPTPSQYYPQTYPPPYSQQPQIIMIPPYPQPQQTQQNNNTQINEQIMYFQKMIQMKNEENKNLMKMLIDTKRQKNPSNVKSKVQQIRQSRVSMLERDGQLSLYHMQTPMDMIPSTQQKILLALQREELDQLRLLSTLPQQLQQLKMVSVMKLIEQRTQLQKQIIQQKVKRLQQQQKNQLYQEQTRLDKDEWANQQRKKLIGHQMDDIIGQFQRKVNGEQSSQDQDQDEQEEYDPEHHQ